MKEFEHGTRIVIYNAWKNKPVCKVAWETEAADCNINELIEGLYGCLIGLTWHPDTVLNAMKDFVEERLPNDSEEN